MLENCGSCFVTERFVDIKLRAKHFLILASFNQTAEQLSGYEQVAKRMILSANFPFFSYSHPVIS